MDRIRQNVLEAIGHTPMVRLNSLSRGLATAIYAKVEYFNPGGSVKDRIGLRMIVAAEEKGLLKPGGTIVEATAGNTGVGLALAAAVKGYRCIFVMPDKMSEDKISLLKAYGAEVVVTPTSVAPDSPESYNGVAERLCREIPGAFRPDQFSNPNNRLTHYSTTGPEIWEDMGGEVDVFVASMGTGGTISGVGRYLKEKNPETVVVGADPEGSILSGDSPHEYKVEGIGEDFIPKNFDRQVVDEMIRISDKESFNTARRLAREEGLLVGGSSGTAVAAALRYAERLTEKKNIVAILPDTGRNYLTKIFSDRWMQENGFWEGEMKPRVTAGQIAFSKTRIPPLVAVHADANVGEALRLMVQYNISQVPVIDNGKSVGSLQETTLMRLVSDGVDLGNQAIGAVMGKPLPEVDQGAEASEAYRILLSHSGALIVLKDGEPKAVLTRIDLVDYYTRRPA
jgi:cystathionine beta-synthase